MISSEQDVSDVYDLNDSGEDSLDLGGIEETGREAPQEWQELERTD